MTTETMTPEQRLEVRRTLLQSVAEMSRGLKVISGFLKLGQFGMARDQIAAVDAMLQLHEMLAQELLKENRQLRAQQEKVLALAEGWRYKGEFGWGAWQEGHGPDQEGQALDYAAGAIRKVLGES